MTKFSRFLAVASFAALAASAGAQSLQFTRPNITTAAGATSVTLSGKTFVNQGLVGVGRVSADTRDFAGETFGSFSGMSLDLKSWRRNSDGTYSGTMFTLPDRGPNDVGPFVGTTDYRNRVHRSTITLAPYTGTANLPATTASQNQLAITPSGGFFLTDAAGANFTGKDAGSNTVTRSGLLVPSPLVGEGAGRISLDSEAIAFRSDGSFYVSDEYAANIYYFDATGRLIGGIAPVAAINPVTAGVTNFTGAAAPTTGRRNNQGLEALAITPDGNRLVTILQSATVQDTNGTNQQTRNNTRVIVYDISATATPTTPVAEYVLQLPTFRNSGNGSAVDRTAAQSEMLALNDTQFLVLSRDGIGRGSGASATGTPVYKSVLLVDTTGATNIAGTAFETGTTPIATNGSLVAGITPVRQVELVNMLNPVQLGRFGLDFNTAPSTLLSLSEKFEALGLVPTLQDSTPQDFFLLVGNDNDFQSATGRVNGQNFDASLTGAGGVGNNDNIVLVYRLSLPTYVDPQALAALRATAGLSLALNRSAAAQVGTTAANGSLDWLSSLRRSDPNWTKGARVWAQGNFTKLKSDIPGLPTLDADGPGGAAGIDFGFGPARVGIAFGYQDISGQFSGFGIDAEGSGFSVYAGFGAATGFYGQIAGATTTDLRLTGLDRPSAYGQTGTGRTAGNVTSVQGEIGWIGQFGRVQAGPFVTAELLRVQIDAYSEQGASVSNLAFAAQAYDRRSISAGVEARISLGSVTPSIRLAYANDGERDATASVRLLSADHALGTATVVIPENEKDRFLAQAALTGSIGKIGWRLGVDGRFASGNSDGRATLGLSTRF